MSTVDFWGLSGPAVLKETGPALADQARNHPRPHAPCQTLPRPTGVAAGILACRRVRHPAARPQFSHIIPSFHQPVLHPALHSFPATGGSAFPTSGALLAKEVGE